MTETTRLLSGRYELGGVLGRGGMAEVHIGRDTRLGRSVAVKLLRSDLARDPSFQARFRREAHSAASLNHPSVVAVYDTGEDVVDGQPVPYIVMEYVEGSTLRDLLVSGRRLLPERAMEIVSGVLAALAYSHRQGIIHRDIKPGNVMLTRSGDVKVMDFGIARAIADNSQTMTQTSAVIGTAQYLSPEQARGEQVDARSDLYSTGCLLYELLTGRPPFVGDSPVSVAYQHVREQALPPSSIDHEIPAAVDAVTLKSLAKDRNERYQTADEMRADLERALAGRQVAAPSAMAATAATQLVPPTPPAAATGAFPMVAEDYPQRGRGGRGLAYALLALAVLAVFVIAALVGKSLFDRSGGSKATVPLLRGLTVAQAQAKLQAAGLTLGDQQTVNSDTVGKGLVVDQTVEPNASVSSGSAVGISVSAGAAQATVPQLVGLSRADAQQALADANLKVGKVTSKESNRPQNEVLKASKAEGDTVPAGSAVDLEIANGSNKVPDVRGKNKDEATAILQEAGFVVQSQERQDGSKPAGSVVDQSLAPNSIRRLGSTVTITVATAPADTGGPSPPVTLPTSPPPTG